jgi:hypothetical protein
MERQDFSPGGGALGMAGRRAAKITACNAA